MANLTFAQLLDVLTDFVNKKRSGTMYIHSDTNHVVTVALDKGRIYAIYHGPKRGRKAIAPMSKMNSGTYRFEDTGLSGVAQDLPSTPEILNALRIPHSEDASTPGAAAHAGADISLEARNKVCQELKDLLSERLGPIAGMVFDGALSEAGDFCATAEGTQGFINQLASDIDDPEEAAIFREQANAALNRVLGRG